MKQTETIQEKKERLARNQLKWRLNHPEGYAKVKRTAAIFQEKFRKTDKGKAYNSKNQREWRLKNPEKVKAYQRTWRLNNPEKCKARKKKYNHSIKGKETMARYYLKHYNHIQKPRAILTPEQIKKRKAEYQIEWQRNNPDKIKAYGKKYREKKRNGLV